MVDQSCGVVGPIHLHCTFRRPHSVELCPGFHPGPDHQCRLFQTLLKTYLFTRY